VGGKKPEQLGGTKKNLKDPGGQKSRGMATGGGTGASGGGTTTKEGQCGRERAAWQTLILPEL